MKKKKLITFEHKVFQVLESKVLALTLLAMGMLSFTSCEKDTPLPYDGTTGITFQPVSMFTDILRTDAVYPSASDTCFTKEFFFTYDEDPEAYRVLTIPVAALGYTMDFDRPVSVEIDSTTTMDADKYEVAENQCNITANNARGLLSVLVKRPKEEDLDTKKLVIRLIPNDYFSYVLGTGSTFTCKVSNTNHKPQYWDAAASNSVNLTQTFGIYSNNKFEFIHETLYNYEEEDDYTEEITYPYRKYADLDGFKSLVGNYDLCSKLQDVLQKAYKEYKEDGGEPILDENTGKEIVFEY